MTLDHFATQTVEILEGKDLSGYLPTVVIFHEHRIVVISDVPEDLEHREALQNKLRMQEMESREFIFGVYAGDDKVVVGHYRPGQPTEFKSISKDPNGLSVADEASVTWWTFPN